MPDSSLPSLLSDLIRVPSVNPAYSDDPSITGERRMADALTPLLEARGLSVQRRDIHGPERPAILASAGAEDAPHSLMFELHLDTVGVAHMTRPPFEGEQENNRIYGRGACDMKGSIAALLHVLTPERVRSLTQRNLRLLVVGAPNEECGTLGARELVKQGLRADHAIILEPTRCRPVVAHKGANWYQIDLHGRSGHGSHPEAGISTNAALVHLLPEVLRIHNAQQKQHADPLLGQSSLNIGRVEGGQNFNIIPDHTRILLDRRVIPSEDPEQFEQAIRLLLEHLVHDGRLLSGTCTRVQQTEAFHTPENAPLPTALANAIEAVTGEHPRPEGTSWVSDAAPFSQVCGQTVVFGPGDIAQAHTADEYIDIPALEQGADILERFLSDYGAPS